MDQGDYSKALRLIISSELAVAPAKSEAAKGLLIWLYLQTGAEASSF